MNPPGLIIAAPRSGAGKTTVALGLMRAFARRGLRVQAFKNGPDYIDPAFHAVATGRPGCNLDSWAMTGPMIDGLIAAHGEADLALVEGSMGLFDGGALPGASGHGASADLAARTGWPVVLVLDVSGQAQSAAATALGFARYRADVRIAGIILNRVASARHAGLIGDACAALGLPVLGALYRDTLPKLEERHLGLVQAGEVPALDGLLDRLAAAMAEALDLDRLAALARPAATGPRAPLPLAPPAQRIALARDDAFSFLYPHLAASWRAAGAEILPFSPLADEAPAPDADLAWLPGGYPELQAGRLAANGRFMAGLRRFAAEKPVHGECGGYMVLGAGLVAADGTRHAMAGLLGLESDFSRRRLHLGYRLAETLAASPLGPKGLKLRGHEFHYATVAATGGDEPLFKVEDAAGQPVAAGGSRRGPVTGSFFHLIAPA
ncbi:cobyrinate a,c-diamide synthase [Zavarzinia compransoris]|uniref:Cobyrinate a,c-diamide synthase n=1 Tax=Zavarzinia compransoris TaxID=1264899 RepID=A0A317E3F8_9PROT|nr:cobyrinate a,c-diamide synthase [Zavarzinia compransoris]PWR19605.1 cobyrinic acid a,c-diamide synthase [Zavarzinia compransoris]TDP40410.1 hydrogenobyrinic acid a,c-diamide synthase (glutamine-hydrolysing) /cobyrinate a,c-diamide synthase [Zavarzinia compransoris]